MKKIAIITLLVIASLIIFLKSGILDSLMLFVLAGVIPGTSYAVPSTFMLLLITCVMWLLIFNLLPFDLLRSEPAKSKKKVAAKKTLPKRRYKQVS
jgi:hypothetical protein